MTAGRRLAAAVPDVQASATGERVARASPSAKKPAARSSRCIQTRRPGCVASAIVTGDERLPGVTHAWRTPARTSSSTSSAGAR